MRDPGGGSRPTLGGGAGSAGGGAAGAVGVGQAHLALSRRRLRGADVVGGLRRDRAAGGADRAGPRRDLSAGWPCEHSVAQVARDFGVGWHTAMAAVADHGRPRVDHLARLGAPSAIGVDETSFLAATVDHPTLLVTGVVDLDEGRLVDVLPQRSAQAVSRWLAAKPARWRAGIAHAVIDPYAAYARGLADGLPDATVVVDHFHVVRLANSALDDVRRRVQQVATGHRGRKPDPLYRIRRRLLAAHERLSPEAFDRMLEWLDVGDLDGEVAAAYLAKELLRETTPPPTATRPAAGSRASMRTASGPRSPSSLGWLERCAAGSTRSWPGTTPG